VEIGGTMAVNYAFGISGGAAGVTHRGRIAFVDLGPIKPRLLRGE
jgi:hypothetical protein